MSYILDALRKSDQQRRLGGVPTLTFAPVAAAASERPTMLFYGLFGVTLLVAVGMTIAWLRPSPSESVVIAPIAAKSLAVPPYQAVPVLLPVVPVQVEPQPTRHEPPSAVASAPVLASPATRRKPSAPVRIGTRSMPPVAVATPQGNADKDSPDDAPQRKPMASSDLPSSIRKTLPAISVAVHAYSNAPRDRLVSINGRMLREGDILAPDLKLEQITPDGMIFTYRGYRFRRGAQ